MNPEQRAAVETTRGPLCILAGAGTGKTTTITRRIAWQVETGAFRPRQIVAVTFTDKAAGELRDRLRALGVEGVRASTFHSAALALLRHFEGDPGRILASKALLLRRIGNTLPVPFRFRPAGDLATEIEWAKNRRLTPDSYFEGLGDHEPPLPPDLARRVFREYERRKAAEGLLDFEDLLGRTVQLLEADEDARAAVHDRWRAFTVDEYQDVNLLQQTLLDLWLGERDDLCAVGDDYQAIYGFTGASARWLLALPRRFPQARVVRLERSYRSTPQVLELANRLVPRLGGSAKTLAPTLPAGSEPVVGPGVDIARHVRQLHSGGLPLEEIAVLVRTNARTSEFEEALHEAGVPFQGASLLARDAARQLLKALRGRRGPAVDVVRELVVQHGLLAEAPDRLGEREQTRQADLARLVRLAEGFDGDVLEEIAVLVRTNARTSEFEEALHEAGVPFQGASLLARDAARQLLKALRGRRGPAVDVVRELVVQHGLLAEAPDRLGEREQTRQADLARLVRLAEGFDGDVDGFVELLHERFDESAGRGVHLLTLHRAKGLEWEAVLLPRIEEGELPIRRGDVEEERRLFYVGLTRARRHLLVTWNGKPSRFLDELGVRAAAPPLPKRERAALEQTPAVQALREWRLARARADEVPAYVVFNDRTLAELVARTPRTLAELAAVPGIGPAKLERYGAELLARLADVAA